MINNLLVSWKESISVFFPQNAKLFFLIFLKTLLSTYKNLLYYGWLALILALLATSFLIKLPLFFVIFINLLWVMFIWFYFIILAARPSIKLKSLSYYAGYWAHGLFLGGAAFFIHWAMQLLFSSILVLVPKVMPLIGYGITLALYPVPLFFFLSFDIYLLLLSPWFVFFALFVSDSSFSLQRFIVSAWRATLMVFYNYPWCLLIYIVCQWGLGMVPLLLNSIGVHYMVNNLIMLLVLPIPITLMTCFYTKRLHDQFGYYFSSNR